MTNSIKFGKYWFFSALAIMDMLYATVTNSTMKNTKRMYGDETELPGSKKLCSGKILMKNYPSYPEKKKLSTYSPFQHKAAISVQREAKNKECANGKKQKDTIENPQMDEQTPKISNRDKVIDSIIEKLNGVQRERRHREISIPRCF